MPPAVFMPLPLPYNEAVPAHVPTSVPYSTLETPALPQEVWVPGVVQAHNAAVAQATSNMDFMPGLPPSRGA